MSEKQVKSSQVQHLAYRLWQQRGMPLGSPEEDWLLAEALLKQSYNRLEQSLREMSLFALGIERRTR